MATTTAAVTLSSDLLSDALSVSASTTCMKAGTTADGLDMMDYGYIDIATGDEYDLLDANNSGLNTNKANKVYIANHSTDETFYIQSGEVLLIYGDDDDMERAKMRVLKPGDKFYVYPGLRHQMQAREDTELFEFSTQHFDSDSNRIEPGD